MNAYQKFEKVDTFIFDIDGVWTSGGLHITEEGYLLRSMNAKDGYACKKALDNGYHMLIITGGFSAGVQDRLEKFGIPEIHTRVHDKLSLIKQLQSEGRVKPESTVYVGDDILDKESMEYVFMAACPYDAAAEIVGISDYVSPIPGGQGCIRDVIEKVLRAHNKW